LPAIAAFVEAESWQLDEIQTGIKKLDEGLGSHTMKAWGRTQGCCELAPFMGARP
jgi:predicted transcriptional regulator